MIEMETISLPDVIRQEIAYFSGFYDIMATRIQHWWKTCEQCSKCNHHKHMSLLDKVPVCAGFNCCYMYACKKHNVFVNSDFVMNKLYS